VTTFLNVVAIAAGIVGVGVLLLFFFGHWHR
jgi:hypothetical protein